MLSTKIQPQSFLGSGEDFFLPWHGMAAILFNGAELFELTDDTPLKEGSIRNLVKIGQAVSEKMMFKDYPFYAYL